MSFWHQLAVELPVALVCFLVIGSLLWRLRSWGYWTVGIGFALFLLLSVVHIRLIHDQGASAVGQGLFLGSMMPTLYMFLYQMKQEKKQN